MSEFYSHYRFAEGNSAKKSGGACAAGALLRLERVGDKVTALTSTDDGASWTEIKSGEIAGMPDEVCLGVAVSSGSNSDSATATFGALELTH